MNGAGLAVDVDALLLGAIDLHVHTSPSPFPRRLSVAQAAEEAANAGFRTIAVKSHHHSTVTDVLAVEEAVGCLPLEALAGIALNNQVGGINPSAVELSLVLGGRLVWFPTISSANHIAMSTTLHTFPTSTKLLRPESPVRIFGEDRSISAAVKDVLGLIAEYDAVLSCGHLSADEIDILIPSAQDLGVTRILVNHPNFVVGASPERCSSWAKSGVFIEHSLSHYDQESTFRKWSIDVLLDYMSAAGEDNTILSSDLGQVGNPTPTQAFRAIIPRLLAAGVESSSIRKIVATSAARLID